MVIYVNDDLYKKQYVMDLIRELCNQRQGNRLMAISNHEDRELKKIADYYYKYECCKECIPTELLAIVSVVLAQILALFKSIQNDI